MDKGSFYIQKDNLYIVPVCHYRSEFAWYVNRAIAELSPDAIAVELPSTLKKYFIKAVKRFPFLSVLFYENGAGEYVYFPIEPTDPLCEGVRTGLDLNIPVHFVDLDLDEYPLVFEPMPDSYSLYLIGLNNYWKAYNETVNMAEKNIIHSSDESREKHMTYHLQNLLKDGKKVLLICGMSHVNGILDKLKTIQFHQMAKAVRKDIRIFNLSLDSIREVTGETPFFISLYEMIRGNHPDKIPEAAEEKENKVISLAERKRKDRVSPENCKNSEKTEQINLNKEVREEKKDIIKFDENTSVFVIPESKYSDFFSKLMKYLSPKLNKMETKEPFAFSSELFELEAKAPSYNVKQEKIHKFLSCEDRIEELLKFYKTLSSYFTNEDLNGKNSVFALHSSMIDREKLIIELLKKASLYYQENTGDEIKSWQTRVFTKFSRNYALITGSLLPDFFQLITCARSVADDNFAYEIWDLCSFYPWIDRSGEYETIDIKADEVWLFGKKITLRRKLPRLRHILRPLFLKDRKNEKKPGDWAQDFDGFCICSYPPEDIIIEDYGNYLKKRGKKMLSQEQARVLPFTSSLLDGIDVKETIRNWHEKKLYVRQSQQINGNIGSVVLIFDEDIQDIRYSWKTTWQGEHGQESDMAFYATSPMCKIVGPGIARCEYGGFMMSYPPMRVWDIWGDPFYSSAQNKAEVLLMAAIEYSIEKYIAYVAAKPPRSWFKNFASRLDKKIVYSPIGSLSPVTLKKLRIFHVLSDKAVREFAKDYIW